MTKIADKRMAFLEGRKWSFESRRRRRCCYYSHQINFERHLNPGKEELLSKQVKNNVYLEGP